MNILIVDDSRVSRGILRAFIENLNYTVVGEAADGATALSLVEKLKPDVVITDIEMPVMDGVELINEIYQNHKDIRTFVVSSVLNKTITERAVLNGAFMVLKKPIDEHILKKALNKRF